MEVNMSTIQSQQSDRTTRKSGLSSFLRTAKTTAIAAAALVGLQRVDLNAQLVPVNVNVNWGNSWPSNWNANQKGFIMWYGPASGTNFTGSVNFGFSSPTNGNFVIKNLIEGETYLLQCVEYTNLPDGQGNQVWVAASPVQRARVASDPPSGLKIFSGRIEGTNSVLEAVIETTKPKLRL